MGNLFVIVTTQVGKAVRGQNERNVVVDQVVEAVNRTRVLAQRPVDVAHQRVSVGLLESADGDGLGGAHTQLTEEAGETSVLNSRDLEYNVKRREDARDVEQEDGFLERGGLGLGLGLLLTPNPDHLQRRSRTGPRRR